MFRATAKCNMDRRITRVISTSTGINGARLYASHLLIENGDVSFLVIFFRNSAW